MIVPNDSLDRFEQRDARERSAHRSYQDALQWLEAAWCYAERMNPDFGADWANDVEADLALARVLNGVPDRT